jgi:predicted phosphodiesterase
MLYGFISDIHGKVERLQATIKALKSRGLDREQIICLGDIVSEMPTGDSDVCIGILENTVGRAVRGNHDDYAIIMRSPHLSKFSLDYLKSLPETFQIGNLTIVHDNPILATREGEGYLRRNNYIDNEYDAQAVFASDDFHSAIVGHTHRAKAFWKNGSRSFENAGTLKFNPEERHIFTVGSVAYSRDDNPAPSCAILDLEKNTFEIIRPN